MTVEKETRSRDLKKPITGDDLRRTMEKAATLVMLQPSAPAWEPTAWIHVPSQPFDAIAAFAVPNPGSSSQSQPVFSGLVARSGRPDEQITQPTSDWKI